jgi:3-hydroxymyristoyl/3-hydroxydecanoyl-(acyl carrier protein) dehydratase
MVTTPHIGATERTAEGTRLGVQFELTVPADLYYFRGHFPECPLLPGVVQVTWAIEFARQHLPCTGDFRSLSAVKFTRVIQPGSTVTLALEFDSATQRLDFEYRGSAGSCSVGTAHFNAQ